VNTLIRYLSVLLIIQLAGVVILNTTGNSVGTAQPATQLLPADIADSSTITIRGKTDQITLKLNDGEWRLPAYGLQAANPTRVTTLLQKLLAIEVTAPVGKSDSAAQRFEVTRSNAQLIVELRQGESAPQILYIGSSPSHRKSYVRTDNDTSIYTAEIAIHDLPTKPEDWFDRSVLDVDGNIMRVKTPHFELHKPSTDSVESRWVLEPVNKSSVRTEQPALDNALIEQWVKRFNSLTVSAWISPQQRQAILIQNPVSSITVETEQNSVDYAFYTHEEKYFVKRFGQDDVYELATQQAKMLIEVTPETFASSGAEPLTSASPEITP